jgi:hypothetical protein
LTAKEQDMLDAEWLLSHLGIPLGGSVTWRQPLPTNKPGIYIVSIDDPASVKADTLPEKDRQFWSAEQAIVYIGRSNSLARRLNQFYQHKYGESRPHAGGQAILNLPPKRVDWALTPDYHSVEDRLIKAFEKLAGTKPFGNRVRSARKPIDRRVS